MHASQREFERPPAARWFSEGLQGPLICHVDLYPPNVILRHGSPAALVDWDLAGPGDHLIDVASAASHWAPLRADGPDDLDAADCARRMRAVCDGYGLAAEDRARLLDRVLEMKGHGYELHRRLGAVERRPGWREMWDAGSGAKIRANAAWIREHRRELEAALE
jgi:thiamine kinase-like enzyme